jgi:hypothetical protein
MIQFIGHGHCFFRISADPVDVLIGGSVEEVTEVFFAIWFPDLEFVDAFERGSERQLL